MLSRGGQREIWLTIFGKVRYLKILPVCPDQRILRAVREKSLIPDLFNTAVLIIYKPPLKQKAWIVCISDECFGSKIKRCLIFSLILLRLPVQESHSTSWCKISGPACIHNGTTSNTQNQKKISALYCPWLGLSSGRFKKI